MKKNKIILTDIDGCVLNWWANIPFFLASKNMDTKHMVYVQFNEPSGFITAQTIFPESDSVEHANELLNEYCESDFMRTLPMYEDAFAVISHMSNNMGYEFHGITSMPNTDNCKIHRRFNLDALFPNIFKSVIHVGLLADKTEAFKQFQKDVESPVVFIDDIMKNIKAFNDSGIGGVPINMIRHTVFKKQDVSFPYFVNRGWYGIESLIEELETGIKGL